MLASGLLALPAVADSARLAQLIDYVGVDYAAAVRDGEVINAFEYAEMQEFSGLIAGEVRRLEPALRRGLEPLAAALQNAVDSKVDPARVAGIAGRMTEILIRSPALDPAPDRPPDIEAAQAIYAQQCAACHGAGGRGEGPAVTPAMKPPPTDFTDPERARSRSLYGLFNTITLGVEGTAMPPFEKLSKEERWSLAFYVGSLHVEPEALAAGERSFAQTPPTELPALRDLTTSSLSQVAASEGKEAARLHAWLRAHPQALTRYEPGPLEVAITGVRRSIDLYSEGNAAAAQDAAVDAYLEGFELAEAALRATQSDLVLEVEAGMTKLRQAIRHRLSEADVRAVGEEALSLLRRARESLADESLSPRLAFISALVILLREGVEAILVLGAMAAFLNKTGRREGMPWLHGGWIAALAVGFLTWIVSNYFIAISGATREITEGITALVAAAVLFYVGFWMHSKLNARRWQHFIHKGLQRALDHRGLWALAGLAFIAAYREVFETVLFYQALLAQAPAAGPAILGGAALGAAAVVGIVWAVFYFGVHLPLRQFFGATAAVMIALAVIFAGKGVAALQEAGKLPLDPIEFPRIELLGIYPTLQTLGAQLAVLAVALLLLAYNARSTRLART